MKWKPHLRLHVRPGTHAGPWWWVELAPFGLTTAWFDSAKKALIAAEVLWWR